MDGEIFRWGSVRITKDIASFGNASYPIANIGSVETRQSAIGYAGCLPASLVGGLTFVLFSVAAIYQVGAVITVLFGTVGVCAAIVVLATAKSKFETVLILKTSSGDVQVFKSLDADLVNRMKRAIETAASSRGR